MAFYDVFELQPPDETFLSTDSGCINANGLAGGQAVNSLGAGSGATWPIPSSPQLISSPSSFIFDLNDNGDAVGVTSLLNTATSRPFLMQGASIIDLANVLGVATSVNGINNKGVIVGTTIDGQGVVYDSVSGNPPTVIPPLPGLDQSLAGGINSGGVVAGISSDSAGVKPSRGFLFAGGVLTDLGSASQVNDINDSGIVAGAIVNNSSNLQAATWDTSKPNPTPTLLAIPSGFFGSVALGVNNHGDVAGNGIAHGRFSDVLSACIFSGGASVDLNTLIPSNSGWHLRQAADINDAGQIVGLGCLNGQDQDGGCVNGLVRGFLLDTVASTNLTGLRAKVVEVVARLIGFQTVDGSGLAIVNGVPVPVGPWGPRVGDYAQKSDILVSLALEEMATHIGNIERQVALRRAALETARSQIEVLLARLRERE
jgi:hypothetical protein